MAALTKVAFASSLLAVLWGRCSPFAQRGKGVGEGVVAGKSRAGGGDGLPGRVVGPGQQGLVAASSPQRLGRAGVRARRLHALVSKSKRLGQKREGGQANMEASCEVPPPPRGGSQGKTMEN